jgi:putative acetyltransferase
MLAPMPALSIRAATADDAAAISALVQQSVRLGNADAYPPPIIDLICANFSPAKVLQRMAEREVFVGEVEGQVAATVSLRGDKLYSLFVAPGRQGTGVGRRLVEHIEAAAARRGVRELRLSAALSARPFYERLGYRLVTFEPRDDGSTWLMSKSLIQP